MISINSYFFNRFLIFPVWIVWNNIRYVHLIRVFMTVICVVLGKIKRGSIEIIETSVLILVDKISKSRWLQKDDNQGQRLINLKILSWYLRHDYLFVPTHSQTNAMFLKLLKTTIRIPSSPYHEQQYQRCLLSRSLQINIWLGIPSDVNVKRSKCLV